MIGKCSRFQIFVSSTYSDLKEEREHVIHELVRIGYIAVGMEQFPATPEEQLEYIERVIDDSDYYVVIVRGKYGSLADDNYSFTEKEFDYAVKVGKPAIAFIYRDRSSLTVKETDDDPVKAAKLKEFIQKLESKRVVRYWDNKNDLAISIKDSLNDLSRRRPGVGWVRGTNAMDPQIINEIEKLRRENQKLENELDDFRKQKTLNSDIFESGDDPIEFEIIAAQRANVNANFVEIKKSMFSTNYNNLLTGIADYIFQELEEHRIRDAIAKFGAECLGWPNGNNYQYSIVDGINFVRQMRYQMEVLKFIKSEPIKYQYSISQILKLTDEGRLYISSLKAKRKS